MCFETLIANLVLSGYFFFNFLYTIELSSIYKEKTDECTSYQNRLMIHSNIYEYKIDKLATQHKIVNKK